MQRNTEANQDFHILALLVSQHKCRPPRLLGASVIA